MTERHTYSRAPRTRSKCLARRTCADNPHILHQAGLVAHLPDHVFGVSGNPDVENAIRNDIDDYVFNILRGQHIIPIPPEAIDPLIDRLIMIARRQAA
jgi:hypothetical protein